MASSCVHQQLAIASCVKYVILATSTLGLSSGKYISFDLVCGISFPANLVAYR